MHHTPFPVVGFVFGWKVLSGLLLGVLSVACWRGKVWQFKGAGKALSNYWNVFLGYRA